MRISDWSSDVCSSDLHDPAPGVVRIDCQGGYAQIGFDAGRPLINDKARRCGIAALAINNCIHFAALWPEVEALEIGRASCRERVCPYVSISVVAVSLNKKKKHTMTSLSTTYYN